MKVRVREAITISNFDKILKSTPLKTRLWVVLCQKKNNLAMLPLPNNCRASKFSQK